MSNETPSKPAAHTISFDDPAPASAPAINPASSLLAPAQVASIPTAVAVVANPPPRQAIGKPVTEEDISQLGSGASQNMDTISNRLLATQRAGDSGELGTQLNQLIITAKGLDPKSISNRGFIGKVLGVFGNAKEKFLANYDTVQKRIDTLVGQIDTEMNVQRHSLTDLDDLAVSLRDYHDNLSAAADKGDAMLITLDAQIVEAEKTAANDAFSANDLADLRDRRNVLAKRVDDFRRNMLLAKQTGPSILMMKQNARDLVTTFDDIKVTTIPVWRGVFAQYLISLGQKQAAALTTSVRDATNEAIRKQADQLGQNAQAIAESRQRSTIDIETLQYNQDSLMKTLDAVAAIEQKGRAARAAAKPQLAVLEKALITRFAGPRAAGS